MVGSPPLLTALFKKSSFFPLELPPPTCNPLSLSPQALFSLPKPQRPVEYPISFPRVALSMAYLLSLPNQPKKRKTTFCRIFPAVGLSFLSIENISTPSPKEGLHYVYYFFICKYLLFINSIKYFFKYF